ncbi:hypothetical protein ABK040_013043 [Willaertia magna]
MINNFKRTTFKFINSHDCVDWFFSVNNNNSGCASASTSTAVVLNQFVGNQQNHSHTLNSGRDVTVVDCSFQSCNNKQLTIKTKEIYRDNHVIVREQSPADETMSLLNNDKQQDKMYIKI